MDYDKLIERLNTKLQSYASYTDSEFARAMEDAIAAIETLRAESIMHHNAADNYFAEANEYREERNDALTELEQMAACIYYKPGGLCRYDGDDPANMCVLGPCPNNKSAEKVLADLARVTAERDGAVSDISSVLAEVEEIRRGYGVDNADADNAFANLCGNYCAKCGDNCYQEAENYRCKNYEWRGIKED